MDNINTTGTACAENDLVAAAIHNRGRSRAVSIDLPVSEGLITTVTTSINAEPKRQISIPALTERPAYRIFDTWIDCHGVKYRPGVWLFGTDKDGEPTQTWICSPLYVTAITHDEQDNNFGRLLHFQNSLCRWREWAMPMDMLRGAGDELRGELLSMGVEIDPSAKVRNLLSNYLQSKRPKRTVRCAQQVGWCGNTFVLPDKVIGPNASAVIFQSGERSHDEYTRSGSLEGWQNGIATQAPGNPLLLLALSASFAGPLLARCHAEGGGLHIVGDSSTGKTTLIEAACATWGGPNFRRSWRATANGMEGAALLFNDNLLALDEISECDPRDVGTIVYALSNGRGKQRAGRSGAARSVARWRCVVLSNGERSIETTMQDGGYRAKAGQGVRLLNIPVARKYGTWDDLHGFPSGTAFSDAIKKTAATHYGHAGRVFLEKLTHDGRDFCNLFERYKNVSLLKAEDTGGQDRRAAGRFALFALAGELATEYGVTGWPEGAALAAATEVFAVWRSQRGKGNDERRQILDAVSDFIDRHGDGRFSSMDASSEMHIQNRAGWWKNDGGERLYLFNAAGMREALKGFDFQRALQTLVDAAVLLPAKTGNEKARQYKVCGRNIRLYCICSSRAEVNDVH